MKKFLLLIAALALCMVCVACAEEAGDPDGIAGVWVWERAELVCEPDGEDACTVQISWGGSAWEMASWVYRDVRYDAQANAFVCEGKGVKQYITFSEDGASDKTETVYEDGSARFYRSDEGKLVWENLTETEEAPISFEYLAGIATSFIFTDEDMNEAMELILKQFEGFEGCELHRLSYTSDEYNTAENAAWLSSLCEGAAFRDVMLFTCDFHSPSDPDSQTSLNLDEEYTDYQWWLAREEGGSWQLVSWGY